MFSRTGCARKALTIFSRHASAARSGWRRSARQFSQAPVTARVARKPDTGSNSCRPRRPCSIPLAGRPLFYTAKDRVRCTAGQDHLEEHRIKPESPTRRVLATCCNSAMFLDFTKGHWLSIFRNRFAQGAPPLEMRVMTKAWRSGARLSDDVPNYKGHPREVHAEASPGLVCDGIAQARDRPREDGPARPACISVL